MSTLPTTKDIKNSANILEQIDIFEKNLYFITYTFLKILKDTVLQNISIDDRIRPTETLCKFSKFIALNLCGETELSQPLREFISIMTQMFLPKQLMNLSFRSFKSLYKEELRQEQRRPYMDYELIDDKSIQNLRKNLIGFVAKMVDHYPQLDTDIPLNPFCEIGKYIADQVCQKSNIFVPILILMSVFTQMIIPGYVIDDMLNIFRKPKEFMDNNNIQPIQQAGNKKKGKKTTYKSCK